MSSSPSFSGRLVVLVGNPSPGSRTSAVAQVVASRLMSDIRHSDPAVARAAVDRYLTLLRAGGSDHPMRLLQQAGVDLSQPDTIRAVVAQLDGLVTRLETVLG